MDGALKLAAEIGILFFGVVALIGFVGVICLSWAPPEDPNNEW